MMSCGIYIHIPFCVRKCNYCAFLSAPADDDTKEQYVQALIREIEHKSEGVAVYGTVYFGGGTPSVLSFDQIERIMKALRKSYRIAQDAEITLEANPGTLGDSDEDVRDTLRRYKGIGINRLSMGVQSLNDEVLRFIGRIHTAEDVRRDYRIAREVGFDNINLDLIFSLPTENSHELAIDSLNELIEMRPEHISCYSLQIEEGTLFGKLYDEGKLREISDEDDRSTYHKVCSILKDAGYEHYEISNFALPGYRSRHNSGYWNMSDYLAFGLGASGFVNGVRYRNTESLEEYIANAPCYEEVHENSVHDNISEAVFTGLRRIEGIRYEDAARYLPGSRDPGTDFWNYYQDARAEAECFVKSGHLIIDDEGLRLTETGIDISNAIMLLFV